METDSNNITPQGGSKAPGNNEGKKPSAMKIVGYNLLVFAAYTVICAVTSKDGGFIFDMFLIGIQFFACIIFAIINRSLVWLLSAIMILIIGFSTCVGLINVSGL